VSLIPSPQLLRIIILWLGLSTWLVGYERFFDPTPQVSIRNQSVPMLGDFIDDDSTHASLQVFIKSTRKSILKEAIFQQSSG
jgi:hypothetical protein